VSFMRTLYGSNQSQSRGERAKAVEKRFLHSE
jgi:hypothetical protein